MKPLVELCREMKLSRQRIWVLVRRGRIPKPTQVAHNRSVYSVEDYALVVKTLKELREKARNKIRVARRRKQRKDLKKLDRQRADAIKKSVRDQKTS
jgi:hypothetical protein